MPNTLMSLAGRATPRFCRCSPSYKFYSLTSAVMQVQEPNTSIPADEACAPLQPSDTPFAFEDRAGAQLALCSDEEQEAEAGQLKSAEQLAAAEQPEGRRRRPAWQDPDDQTAQINLAAKSQLRKLRQADKETVLTGGDLVVARLKSSLACCASCRRRSTLYAVGGRSGQPGTASEWLSILLEHTVLSC